MSRTLPTPILALAAAAAMLLDLSVAGSASFADAAEDAATPQPVDLPLSAFLATVGEDAVKLDGIALAAHHNTQGQYEVVFDNTGGEARNLRLELTVSHTSGSPMDRMPAFPMQIHTEIATLTLPADSKVSRALGYDVPRPQGAEDEPSPSRALIHMGSFEYDEVGVRILSDGDTGPYEVLRLSSAAL
ncbi:MAG: hypothetical protein KC912_00870 [Proteobacteria bacterium]|nr:hypothetical protein [Pseudomonadota bacterium]